jgi:putative ATP-dependent endonuclease of OLD family
MKIKRVEISNYRNLDSVIIMLEDECNFVVGENNLGKSNFLTLLNLLFTSRNFKYDDFVDPAKPIEIQLSIKLADVEIGHFQDLFDSDDFTIINILARQENVDDNIVFLHKETNSYIPASTVRCINYIHYDSLRNPISEINFDKGKGVGRFLRNIITQYLTANELTDFTFLDESQMTQLLGAINQKISKVKAFNDFNITAVSDDDIHSMLSKVVVLRDKKGNSLSRTGYGVQFLILVTLSILEKLQIIQQQRGERGVFENLETHLKSISLLVGLDEPEIHLHPYMQRSLIKYMRSIMSNENSEFSILIKQLFGIDAFIGQIIAVTHSPNIILNDFKQIIRFYSESQTTKVISGEHIVLDFQLQKHLIMSFPFIKEAFFSRCVIFVEGETELSSFAYFAQKMAINFDDLGICVIQARGGAVPQLIRLATSFGIQSIGIIDRDDKVGESTNSKLYYTHCRDFEAEIVSLLDSGKEDVLRKIFLEYDDKGVTRKFDSGALTKNTKKHGFDLFSEGIKLSEVLLTDIYKLKAFYLTWFSVNKSAPLGMQIGKSLAENEIPAVYKELIAEAKQLLENV